MPQPTSPPVTSTDAVRAAAERAARDLLLVYERAELDGNDQHAISTTRGLCHEVADGDRRVI